MMTKDQYVDLWNEKHISLVEYRNNQMADWCEQMIDKAKTAYYTGKAIMDDETYDAIENDLKLLRPTSKMLKKVGYTVNKIPPTMPIPFPMPPR